jgi:tetratricopeptide (TPR) repeat protein
MTHRLTWPQFWLAILAALVVSGCSETYTPSEATVAGMNLPQARTMFTEAAYAIDFYTRTENFNKIEEVRFEDQGAKVTLIFSNQHDAPWSPCSLSTSRIANTQVYADPLGHYAYVDLTVCKMDGLAWLGAGATERAKEFVNAAYVLSHGAEEARRQEDAAFAEIADQYRSAAVKPPLPEQARAYMVQAQGALNNRNDDDAISLYQKALEVAPWIPGAHYNVAQIMASKGDYYDAIPEMKKYLMLVPNAPDARAAQDQIYLWQGQAQRGQ